jgi:hypothetical protein
MRYVAVTLNGQGTLYLQSQSSSSAGRQFLLRVPFSEPFVEQAFHKLVNGCRYHGLAGTVTLALSQRDAEHLCRRLLVRCKPKHFQCRSEFVRGHRHHSHAVSLETRSGAY